MPIAPAETALLCASCSQRLSAVGASEFLRCGLRVRVSLVIHPQLSNTQLTSTFLSKVLCNLDPFGLLNEVCQSRLECVGKLELSNFQATARASGPVFSWQKSNRVYVGLAILNRRHAIRQERMASPGNARRCKDIAPMASDRQHNELHPSSRPLLEMTVLLHGGVALFERKV